MKRVAFLTTEALDGYETDDHLLIPPLEACGWSVEMVPWRQAVDWDRFELVLIRTPWDYTEAPQEFVELLGEIDRSKARLENPLELVRWNMHKSYLGTLRDRGVAIVPTIWGAELSAESLDRLFEEFGTTELVCKPNVGASASDVFRLSQPADEPTVAKMAVAYREHGYFAQPFVQSVVDEGEFSVFFAGGAMTHAILKTPRPGDFRTQEEHGSRLLAIHPEPTLIAAAIATVEALEVEPLYARVDLVRSPDGGFWLMELELIEPSFYFRLDERAPQLFAEAVEKRVAR